MSPESNHGGLAPAADQHLTLRGAAQAGSPAPAGQRNTAATRISRSLPTASAVAPALVPASQTAAAGARQASAVYGRQGPGYVRQAPSSGTPAATSVSSMGIAKAPPAAPPAITFGAAQGAPVVPMGAARASLPTDPAPVRLVYIRCSSRLAHGSRKRDHRGACCHVGVDMSHTQERCPGGAEI